MKKMEFSTMATCLWGSRFEVLGVILLAIATGLTISSDNSLGIVALFAAGVIFCLFNKYCCYVGSLKQPSCPVCNASHADAEESSQIQENDETQAKQAMDNEGGNQINRRK